MEVSEFAKNLLLGSRLEDKLFRPSGLEDNTPKAAFKVPKYPGRPKYLKFEDPRKPVSFPAVGQLSSEFCRGQILHFFANHELLAIELMALSLLKFPQANKKFRADTVKTILEEQSHLRLYLARMQELGVEFGDIPVNEFFWSSLHGMPSV